MLYNDNYMIVQKMKTMKQVKEERSVTILQSVKEQKELAGKFNKVLRMYNEKLQEKVDTEKNKLLSKSNKWERLSAAIEDEEGFLIKHIAIAGGAVRDWKQNIPAKDVDFFLNIRCVDEEVLINCINSVFGDNSVEEIITREKSSYQREFIKVCDVMIKGQTLIQIICCQEFYYDNLLSDSDFAEKVINSFDFNLNKCFAVFDDSDRLWFEYTDLFGHDLEFKKLTFNLTQMVINRQYVSIMRMPDRIRKMKEKYQGFDLEVV